MRIVDLVNPFAEFVEAFPHGYWECRDGIVVFVTNEFLEDEGSIESYRELLAPA